MIRIICALALAMSQTMTAYAQSQPGAGSNQPFEPGSVDAILSEASGSSYDQDHAKLIKSAAAVGVMGADMFGESTNLYTGGTAFSHLDYFISGNSELAVGVARRLSIEDQKFEPFGNALGDWELEIPYISGIFMRSAGWKVSVGQGGSNERCSLPTTVTEAWPIAIADPSGIGDGFDPMEYWRGYSMYVPGAGEQSLLLNNLPGTVSPSQGGPYPWVTNAFWQIRCAPLSGGGEGEGFVALAPDGTKYFFTRMVKREYFKIGEMGAPDPVSHIARWTMAERDEIRIYATRVEDRFGNFVDYHWVGDRLDRITSSDNRTLVFHYTSDGERIDWVENNGARVVDYQYDSDGSLFEVIYQDQSKWILNLSHVYAPHFAQCVPGDRPTNPALLADWVFQCWDRNSPPFGYKRKLSGVSANGTLKHPSGATATFTFAYRRHTRASVLEDENCLIRRLPGIPGMPNIGEPDDHQVWHNFCWTPQNFDVLAITGKRISGVGLDSPMIWTYDYDVYSPSNPHPSVPVGEYAPHTRKVIVKEPGDIRREFNFGNRYNVNEGQLLRLDTYRGHEGGTLVHSTINTYVLKEEIAPPTYQFPPRVGTNPLWTTDNIWAEWLLPMTSESTRQDQVTYTNTQEQFDEFAKPLQVRSWNELGTSRTDITEYHHDLQHWVLGQVRRVENLETGREVSLTEYDSVTALPYAQSSFGGVPETLAYHTVAPMKGRLWTATDGRGLTTTLTDYVRGVPQRIEFSDNTAITAVVDPLGRIIQTTDAMNVANQFTTYGYDLMGRLTSVQYPQNGALWTPRSLLFAPAVGTPPYELPGGLWKHTITTGNAVTSTYYDQMWRPILISTEDIGDPDSRSLVVKRYDVRGREIFTSYPVNGAGGFDFSLDLDGVHTEYDDLDRVTKVTTDGEPEVGLLETRTEYLSGLRTRVTNPRGKVTTTTYQAYGAPSYDSPILIQAPEGVTTMIERDNFGKPLKVTRTGPKGLHQ